MYCVQTTGGKAEGFCDGTYVSFKGIPYAKADRFCPPTQAVWSGIKNCTQFGKKAMQVISQAPWLPPQSREDFDEDCLNLNIYVPCRHWQGSEKLPVLVEIHGGAFQTGSNQEHAPAQVIRSHDFIYVSVNYRLGLLGFLAVENLVGDRSIPRISCANNGLLDQLAALQWIFENISVFGGDPEKITVLGGSAGAKSIGALMFVPRFQTYVSQVIMSSGAFQSIRSRETSQITAQNFGNLLKKYDLNPEMLFTMDADRLMELQKEFCDCPGNTCMFGPVADGVLIPEDWEEEMHQGHWWHGNVMAGSSRNELFFYAWENPDLVDKASEISRGLFGKNGRIAGQAFERLMSSWMEKESEYPDRCRQSMAWVKIFTDYMYRTYTYRLAAYLAATGSHVWQYSTELAPACHCFDQMLAWNTQPNPMFFKTPEDQERAFQVGQMIYESFVSFVENGHPQHENIPDWPEYQGECPVQMYWDHICRVGEIPENDVLNEFPETVYIL